jgi:Carboxypeptidase regulatory-like domain/TonB dependent receptor
MKSTYKLLGYLAVALIFSSVAFAQVDTGTLLGTVTDSSGAVIPGARVTLTQEGTQLVRTSDTRSDGTYIFTPIKIGQYSVEIEFKGFQRARRTGIQVNIQQQVVVDFTMTPGEITQTVEVEATAPLLQTQSGSVGQVVNAQAINNLPLSGRNYTFLARLTAGVTHAQSDGRGLAATGWFAANGTRPAQNNFLLDGIDNNSNNVDFLSGAAYVVKPPVDALSEFKLQTSSFGAEFGRAGGAVLNATLKSGTNSIHGSAWEFLRNDKLDAADFFQHYAGGGKGAFRQNQFGFTLGGPVIKNKTFFFLDYEGTKVRQAAPWSGLTVPTQAERDSGYTNFSDLIALQSGTKGTDALGRTVVLGTIFDPATTRNATAGQVDPATGLTATNTGVVRDPFAGNIIPASRLDPNAVKLLSLFPAPNASGLNGNYSVNRGNTEDTHAFDTRMDHNFSERDTVFGRFSWSDSQRFRPGPYTTAADGGGFNNGNESLRTMGAALSYTHSFAPTLINEFRIGFNREHVYRVQANGDDTSDLPGKYGVPGILQTKGNGGLPYFGIGGLSQLGSSEWLVSERFSNTYQLTENLTKIYGSHTFKGGFEAQKISFPWDAPPYSRGEFDFGGNYTSSPNLADGSTGRAQFLLLPVNAPGSPFNGLGGANNVAASNFGGVANDKYYMGAYFQDDWKISRKLTLNLGLRWDFFSLVGEKYGAQANFVPGANPQFIIPTSRKDKPGLSQSFTSLLAKDGIQLVYSDKYGSGLGNAQKHNLAPRLGFAYQLTSKLVLRGGYGMYYGSFENRGGYPNLGYNYPFQFTFGFPAPNDVTPVTYGDGAFGSLENGLLHIPMDTTLVDGHGLALRGIEFNYKTPYTQGANLTWQYEFLPNNSLEIGYVGTYARHIETFTGSNTPFVILPPGTNPNGYIQWPDFGRGQPYARTAATSNYSSLQTKYTRRFSKGLDMMFAYTYAKTLTNAGDLLSGGNVGGFRAPDLPNWGIKYDYGLASFNVKHAVSYAGTYQLPMGRGRSYMADTHGIQQAVLGGWDINWVLALYSGQPQTIGCTIATTSGMGCYPLVTGDIYANQSINHFYNAAAFTNPSVATTIGQTDYSPLGGYLTPVSGPPFHKLDFSLFKQFPFKEKYRFEFRAESFNLTNTPNFSNPGSTNFSDANSFGKIYSTRNNPNDAREIQMALKFYW